MRGVDEAWEKALWPMYEEGFRYQERWHKRAEEALASLRHWTEELSTTGAAFRTPFPYMEPDNRRPSGGDLLWMYIIVGLKLERSFGLTHVFIPEHVHSALVYERHYLNHSVWGMLHRATSLRDIKTWWLHIQRDLRMAESLPNSNAEVIAGPTAEQSDQSLMKECQSKAGVRAGGPENGQDRYPDETEKLANGWKQWAEHFRDEHPGERPTYQRFCQERNAELPEEQRYSPDDVGRAVEALRQRNLRRLRRKS